jgi:uncharacterized protein (TIGR00369 family)
MDPSASPRIGPLPWAEIVELDGMEILRRMLDGRLPLPHFGATMAIRPLKIEKGRVVFEGKPSHAFTNPQGTMHGGWLATLLDSTTGMAVQSTLKPGSSFTTTALTAHFVRPLRVDDGPVTCTAEAIYCGERTASAEGRIENAKGKLLAHGVANFFIIPVSASNAVRAA